MFAKAPEVANLRDTGAAEAILGDVLGRIACPILESMPFLAIGQLPIGRARR